MIFTAEGSAVEGKDLLRLHHGQPVADLYAGITNSLYRRALQHKNGTIDSFTKRYNIYRLVYYEVFHQGGNAIEKQIKSWTRAKRLALIKTKNPTWQDLAEGWGEKIQLQIPRCAR